MSIGKVKWYGGIDGWTLKENRFGYISDIETLKEYRISEEDFLLQEELERFKQMFSKQNVLLKFEAIKNSKNVKKSVRLLTSEMFLSDKGNFKNSELVEYLNRFKSLEDWELLIETVGTDKITDLLTIGLYDFKNLTKDSFMLIVNYVEIRTVLFADLKKIQKLIVLLSSSEKENVLTFLSSMQIIDNLDVFNSIIETEYYITRIRSLIEEVSNVIYFDFIRNTNCFEKYLRSEKLSKEIIPFIIKRLVLLFEKEQNMGLMIELLAKNQGEPIKNFSSINYVLYKYLKISIRLTENTSSSLNKILDTYILNTIKRDSINLNDSINDIENFLFNHFAGQIFIEDKDLRLQFTKMKEMLQNKIFLNTKNLVENIKNPLENIESVILVFDRIINNNWILEFDGFISKIRSNRKLIALNNTVKEKVNIIENVIKLSSIWKRGTFFLPMDYPQTPKLMSYRYLKDYLSVSRFGNIISKEALDDRNFIYDFKNGRNYKEVALIISNLLKTIDIEGASLVPIPASTNQSTEIRYSNLCKMICYLSNIHNGYGSFLLKSEDTKIISKHNGGSGISGNLDFLGTETGRGIIIDDLVTHANTLISIIQLIKRKGSFKVFCISLGKTPL